MIKILASDGMEKSAIAALEAKGCQVDVQFYDPDALCEAVKNYDALIVRSATKVREPQIDAACMTGKLKIVIRAGVGIDNIDKVCAEGHGISVCNTPRASSNAVAELALAHMLSVARFISAAGHTMREGKWEKKAYEGIELAGKTVGIVGYGRIGQTLGKSCQALGMNVLAYDIYKVPELECETMRYVEMDDLLSKSDFVSLHVPSLPGQPLINAETLAKMKDGVIIITPSRGTNVDEAALLKALEGGKVYGAGLDVFAEEPAKNAALYTHPRVSSTPHIGASTEEAQKRIGAEIVDILVKYFNL